MAVNVFDINQRIADALGIDLLTQGVTHIRLDFDVEAMPTVEVTVLLNPTDDGEQLCSELRRYQLAEIADKDSP